MKCDSSEPDALKHGFWNKASQLKEAAKRNPFQSPVCHGQLVSLNMYIQMLFQFQEHLAKLKKEIDALALTFEDYEFLQSFPGIGNKIAATILSEIEDINLFQHQEVGSLRWIGSECL